MTLRRATAPVREQFEDGFAAYRAISEGDRSPEARVLISDVMANLTLRRTMRLTNPAYQDLLSTGNLDLIRNRALRDEMVAFYERTEREFEIHHLNNASYVDALFRDGLFMFRGPARSTMEDTNEADSLLIAEARGGYADDPDPIWNYPYTSLEWQMVKGQLLSRIRISLYSRVRARNLLAQTGAMKAAIEAERMRWPLCRPGNPTTKDPANTSPDPARPPGTSPPLLFL